MKYKLLDWATVPAAALLIVLALAPLYQGSFATTGSDGGYRLIGVPLPILFCQDFGGRCDILGKTLGIDVLIVTFLLILSIRLWKDTAQARTRVAQRLPRRIKSLIKAALIAFAGSGALSVAWTVSKIFNI